MPKIVSHRGANHFAPENTFAAADLALQQGADYIELDVRESADGVLYVFHDETLDRTTNGTGPIGHMLSSEIDALDAGSGSAKTSRVRLYRGSMPISAICAAAAASMSS
nr:glycerophosphodiester phosphodiesterase family protein [Rhizobium sp. 28DA2]